MSLLSSPPRSLCFSSSSPSLWLSVSSLFKALELSDFCFLVEFAFEMTGEGLVDDDGAFGSTIEGGFGVELAAIEPLFSIDGVLECLPWSESSESWMISALFILLVALRVAGGFAVFFWLDERGGLLAVGISSLFPK